MTPNILTMAGSDSGGGAGIQADIKTIMALGGYGMSVVTALTAQNGLEVAGIHSPPPQFVALQLKTVLAAFPVAAAKTGMLFSAEIIEHIASVLAERDFPLVVDPVSVSQSGSQLLEDSAVDALKILLLPNSDLFTPNAPEAELFTGIKVTDRESAVAAGEALLGMGARAVLVKGGHLPGDIVLTDYLILPGEEPKAMPQAKVDTCNNHGTGCSLSAAIACCLGRGLPLQAAVVTAQRYLNICLRKSYSPGQGCGPINHAAGFGM